MSITNIYLWPLDRDGKAEGSACSTEAFQLSPESGASFIDSKTPVKLKWRHTAIRAVAGPGEKEPTMHPVYTVNIGVDRGEEDHSRAQKRVTLVAVDILPEGTALLLGNDVLTVLDPAPEISL